MAVRHERDDLVHMRVGVDVMQPHPDAELAERARKVEEFSPHLAAFPIAGSVFQVDPIGRRVLRDDEEFLDAGGNQPFRLAQHVGGRPGDQVAAQMRDDAKCAAIITTL